MLAGFSEIEFTPAAGNSPGGFFPNYLEGNDGGLYSNVVAITSGDSSAILISMDTLFFSPQYGNKMRQRISDATGVPGENIFIAGTHTHSGACVEYEIWLCPADVALTDTIADKTVDAAIRAWNARAEAKLGVGITYNDQYNFCRDFYKTNGDVVMNPGYDKDYLVRPISTPDHSVNVMRFDDADGNVKCFIVNYSNHPCCPEYREDMKKKFSADYPGYLRRALKEKYGQDVTVLFFTGAAGDVNCIDYQFGTTKWYSQEKVSVRKVIGEAIAQDVAALNPRIFATTDQPVILTKSEIHKAVRRQKTEADYQWAVETLERAKNETVSQKDIAFATDYTDPDNRNAPGTVDLEIHTLQIGPWAIVGLPGEIFTYIGKRIKALSPYPNTIIVELANGTNGYITPDHIQKTSTYEAKYAKYNACTGFGTADMLVRESVRMLEELYEKDNQIRFTEK